MVLTITLVLVIITCLISISAFSQQKIIDDLIFYPPAISRRKQFYRFITHGLIHADYIHLAFNMIALYSFGTSLEKTMSFDCVFGERSKLFFLLLYVTGLVMASLPDYIKYRDSYHFRSLGASGAVSAVIFSNILFFPQATIYLFIPLPGYLFALVYLGVTVYLDRRGGGNINHSAHFWGAAYGVLFTVICCTLFADSFDLYENFMVQIKSASRDLVLLCQ